MSYPICRDLQQQKQFFDGVFCRAATTINFSTGGEPRLTAAELVSGTYFSVLGVSPALGRLLTIDDDQAPGSSPVVVLSYDFWKNQFGGAQDIVGRKVLVNRYPMTVVGVAAPTFHGIDVGEVPSLWIPAVMSAQAIPGFDTMLDRRTRWMQILGRLKQNVSLAEARTGLQPWFKAMLDEDTRRTDFSRFSAEQRQQFLASTLDLTAAPEGHSVLRQRPFAAALGLVRGDGGAPGSGLPECGRTFFGARLGSPSGNQHQIGIGSIARANWTAASSRQPASRICRWTARRSDGACCRTGAHRIPAPSTVLRTTCTPT